MKETIQLIKFFFQEDDVMNIVLNVFFYQGKPECFLTSDFPTKKGTFSLQGR